MDNEEKKSKKGLIIGIIAAIVVIAAIGGAVGSGGDKDDSSSGNETGKISSSQTESKKETESKEESKAAEESSEAEPEALPTVGEYVQSDSWKISFLDAKQYDSFLTKTAFLQIRRLTERSTLSFTLKQRMFPERTIISICSTGKHMRTDIRQI